MDIEFWLENWKQNKIGFHQQQTNPYLTMFWDQLNLEPNTNVFVPLCGKSLDLIWLVQQGHKVTGVEISGLAVPEFFSANNIKASRTEIECFQKWQAEQLIILQGNLFDLNSIHVEKILGVFDRASLVALPIETRKHYVQHLTNILSVKAKILLITFEYKQIEMQGPPFSVNQTEIQSLYSENYEIKLLHTQDVLTQYPHFQELGLTSLKEKIYLLNPYSTSSQ